MDKELLAALIRIIILLPLICVLAYLTVRFGLGRSKHLAAYGAGKRMRVLEQVSMGPKCGLTLTQVGDRYMLFAHQENCIILVREMDQPPEEISAAAQAVPGLAQVIQGIRTKRRK
ncbi:MAG TPA: flagellar biosynthetic protein FliO [Desulfotomaculum sp.]|nr:flagellar biosynthetic protein FliO [Desulfotomaculum sp.]